MSIEISKFDGEQPEWNQYVDRSPQGTVYHRAEFLETLAEHTAGTLHRLLGHKGQEPVGAFPVFEIEKFGVSTLFSPTPRMGIPYQGPIFLNMGKLKRRKRERRQKRFVSNCLEWCSETLDPSYINVRTVTTYNDPRPFRWNEFDVQPRYTYLVDLDREPEEIKRSFSKSLRRYLDPDDAERERYTIIAGEEDDIRFIYRRMESRYEVQGKDYGPTEELLLDLYERLPDGMVRPYIGLVDGEREAGILALEDDNAIYFHEGGWIPEVDFPINDLLHWQLIRDAQDRNISYYDLSGANAPRLCKYKSKFSPNLVEYYELERSTPVMKAASTVYKRWVI